MSSIVKWGYQGNFKPVYFFTKRFWAYKKHQRFPPSKKFLSAQKLLPLLLFVRLFLFLLVGFGWFAFLYAQDLFVKKTNWLKIVLIASFYYTTDLYLYQPTRRASIYTHLFLFVTVCENLFEPILIYDNLWESLWK